MLRSLAFLPLIGLLAACAPTGTVSTPADHPASPAAATATTTVEVAALDPAPQPDLPAVLRPDGHPPAGSMAGMDPVDTGAMDHDRMMENPAATMEADEAAMSHTAMNHMDGVVGDDDDDAPGSLTEAALPTEGLGEALDAYLSVQTALASDELPNAADTRAFGEAVAALVEAPPEADPHFWHMRSDKVRAVQAAATALAEADDLDASRVAFGEVSAPFAGWVEALGVPEGYDVARFTCGMFRKAPEGGVWLQHEGDTRNPYYGSAMLTCGTQDRPMPQMDHEGMGRDGMDHEGMQHDDMNHDDHN